MTKSFLGTTVGHQTFLNHAIKLNAQRQGEWFWPHRANGEISTMLQNRQNSITFAAEDHPCWDG